MPAGLLSFFCQSLYESPAVHFNNLLPKHFPTKYAPIRPITTAEVQTAQNINLFVARGVAAKNNRNGIYGPGIIAHSKAIISQKTIHNQMPELE